MIAVYVRVHHYLLLLVLTLQLQHYGWCTQPDTDPFFVIIIPSYNNKDWYKKNLDSLFSQTYTHFHLIYIDDCSTDNTGQAVSNYITRKNTWHKTTLIQNKKRNGALANIYNAVHTCNDTDIIVLIDGDDWLAHKNVLSYLAKQYTDKKTWMTFGQYITWPENTIGHCRPIAKKTIQEHTYRNEPCYASHLKTCYAWLCKQIEKKDLQYNNTFFPVAWDWALLYPMLEMAGTHAVCLLDILYVYNTSNPLSDRKKNAALQNKLAHHIQKKDPYNKLQEIPMLL